MNKSILYPVLVYEPAKIIQTDYDIRDVLYKRNWALNSVLLMVKYGHNINQLSTCPNDCTGGPYFKPF